MMTLVGDESPKVWKRGIGRDGANRLTELKFDGRNDSRRACRFAARPEATRSGSLGWTLV
jgi:hypothetical protein